MKLLGTLLCVLTCVCAAPGAEMITVAPPPSQEVILNPGKGWVLYGIPANHTPQTLALGTVGYMRFNWADIESAEGRYNWPLIDEPLTAWAKSGKQFAFGVMCANSHAQQECATPKWVFDAGAKAGPSVDMAKLSDPNDGLPGVKYAPIFDGPVFLKKLAGFVTALGKRYDGNPSLAFIDIRSYGNWGEGHNHPFGGKPISPEALKEHIQLHRQAFRRTRLCIPWGTKQYDAVYDWAVSEGVAIRRDGICGNSDGSETRRALGLSPAIFEFYGSYEYLKEKGWWEGKKDKKGYGHRLEDCVENGRPSYIGMSQWGKQGQTFLAAERPLIEKLANRMGYHFVLTKAEFPARWKNSTKSAMRFSWKNEGVAPVYVPCAVAVALLDDKGLASGIFWLPERPGDWLPGKTSNHETPVSFSGVKPGEYRLAVGLSHHVGDVSQVFRLGNRIEIVNGWHVLGKVVME